MRIENAKNIHTYLEIKTDFSSWIKQVLNKYDFVENEDYIVNEFLKNGTKIVDYFLTNENKITKLANDEYQKIKRK